VRLTDGELRHVESKYWLTLTQTNSPTWEVCVLNETLGLFWHVAQRPDTLAALALGWPSSWPIGTNRQLGPLLSAVDSVSVSS